MDHRKIEWLFLILFCLVDIYLLIELWRAPVTLTSSTNSVMTSTSLKAEMKSDNITVPSLSRKGDSGYYLATRSKSDLKEAAKKLSSDVSTSYAEGDKTLYATMKTAIPLERMTVGEFKNDSNYVPHGKQYVYAKNLSSNSSYVYVQKSQYGLVYSSLAQLVVNVKNKKITGYYQTYLTDLSSVRELQATISPLRVVTNLYTIRELADNSRVMQVKLGYTKLTEVRGSVIFVPTWLVWIENKSSKSSSLKRVNAFSGQLLQNSTLDD